MNQRRDFTFIHQFIRMLLLLKLCNLGSSQSPVFSLAAVGCTTWSLLLGSGWKPHFPECTYIINEPRLLLGEAFFFFHCHCKNHLSYYILHGSSPSHLLFSFYLFIFLVSYCRSFLLCSPYFRSPECHKAARQEHKSPSSRRALCS